MSAPPLPSPPYMMLQENNNGGGGSAVPPPPYRGKVAPYTGKQKKRGRCFKFICCCYCFLFVLIILSAALLFCFYTFYNPKVPSYEVQVIDVKAFDVQHDFSLKTEFLLTIKAYNPNKALGFIYGDNNYLNVMYNDTNLCSGKLPAFHQGTENTTMMQVMLSGKTPFGSGLQEVMMENKHNRRIPLLVKVKVPVRIVVFDIPLRQFQVFVNCSLVVDNLSPKQKARIISSKYNLNFAL